MILLRGMYGVGDCLHQRAILRVLLATGERVVLETFYSAMYEDLVRDRNLELRLLCGIEPRVRDRRQAYLPRGGANDRRVIRHQISYNRETIRRHGSILAAQFASAGLRMPEQPDFSLPVHELWRAAAMEHVRRRSRLDRPLMVLRPSVLNDVWLSRARAPDPVVYMRVYEAIRDQFTVVTVANIGQGGERFDGDEPRADVNFTRGQLGFEELAGLFASARLVLTCPGFAPVLAQAVGTPVAIVYGGNESFRTTNSVGAHLAPTLAIEPIRPCACHLKNHDCDKTIDMSLAVQQIEAFARTYSGQMSCAS